MPRQHLFQKKWPQNGNAPKGGIGLFKPIPPNMVSYFRNLPPETDYLFYRKLKGRLVSLEGSLQKAWDRCIVKAKISDFRLHDCRHIAATNLINLGNPSHLVMQVAGWRSDMLKIYYHRDNLRAIKELRF
jgi:integrase